MWVQPVPYNFFSPGVLLPYFSMSILSLPLLGFGSKATSLGPGFCLLGRRQYNMICWELNLIFRFFAFFWLIIWADGINKCSWSLAWGRGCWLKCLHQIPSVSWIYHHPLHFHICDIAWFVPAILCSLYCYYKCWGNGTGGDWLIYKRVWERGQGVGIILEFFCFFFLFHLCFSRFFSHVLFPFVLSN